MRLTDFDYELPKKLIAQEPIAERDQSRLLVLGRDGSITHGRFYELPEILGPNDVLVLNDTRVLPARLVGKKKSGGKVEVLLCERLDRGRQVWLVRVRASRSLRVGSVIFFSQDLEAELVGDLGRGRYGIKFNWRGDFDALLERHGLVPLPPYIKRNGPTQQDKERYQTVFAKWEGACAAPTAGLHFTPMLIDKLRSSGVEVLALTLHVGPGTFAPIRTDVVEDHRMEGEWYSIPQRVADVINHAKRQGKRLVAVGTSSTRALESAFEEGRVVPGTAMTRLFITPGYRFCVVDSLLTNFHLPRSTPLVLLSALVGREKVLSAYEEAKRLAYRFYSYGDAFFAL
jgi:S-adenosylmethionine:tRNA ribosyltransferase-isomerase